MGIFERMKTVISSNINDLISKSENPEKMLNQLVLDMNEQMIESKKAVAMAIADEKKLQADAEAMKKQAEDWERRAMLAVQENRDDLAKQHAAVVQAQFDHRRRPERRQPGAEQQEQQAEQQRDAQRGGAGEQRAAGQSGLEGGGHIGIPQAAVKRRILRFRNIKICPRNDNRTCGIPVDYDHAGNMGATSCCGRTPVAPSRAARPIAVALP